jgi:1-acyl-sn-glycerol-3-phosphate acyltransferase
MVATSELFRVPIWTGALRAAGFVEVNRKNRISAMRSLDRARDAIVAGTSIWIAPEGTRSPDGKLGAFKKGGFHMAEGAGARILPVSVDGTRRILPAKGTRVRNGEQVHVVVHEPVATRDADQKEVMALVRQRIQSGLSTSE